MLKKVYPQKVYKTLARACRYANVLPSRVQPVFEEVDGLIYRPVGFCVGAEKTSNGVWLSYRKVTK